MATNDQAQERKVSVNISVRIGSLTQSQAQALEDAIRDLADDYNADVQAVRGTERPSIRG
jgi:hypothetical protein